VFLAAMFLAAVFLAAAEKNNERLSSRQERTLGGGWRMEDRAQGDGVLAGDGSIGLMRELPGFDQLKMFLQWFEIVGERRIVGYQVTFLGKPRPGKHFGFVEL